jgi:hypothetical protein
MKPVPARTRVRQLAESVWPGRTVDGYANLIAVRLRKLAGEASTGMLPMSGHGDGAIFFRGGHVVFAESSRTSASSLRAADPGALTMTRDGPRVPGNGQATTGQATTGHATTGHATTEHATTEHATTGLATTGELVPLRSVSRLASMLALTEPTIDAVTELLSSESRYAKFRPGDGPPVARVRAIAVNTLLTEVQRRREVLRQLTAVVTPDTRVTLEPSLDSPAAQVSAAQWSLLVHVGDGTTPRALAMAAGHSVFGTTVEVYRLLALGLLSVPGRPPAPGGEAAAGWPKAGMSFMSAVSGERGSNGEGSVGDRSDRRGTADDQAERPRNPREHHRHP